MQRQVTSVGPCRGRGEHGRVLGVLLEGLDGAHALGRAPQRAVYVPERALADLPLHRVLLAPGARHVMGEEWVLVHDGEFNV